MVTNTDKEKIARENVLRECTYEPEGKTIQGYDFDNGVDYKQIFESFETTGFQATSFFRAKEIIRKMIDNQATIFLGYTSSMVTSGLRDIFRFLAEHKKINCIVTTGGGIEEDIMKCLGTFILGKFTASGVELRKKAINRTGNIFVPDSRYLKFEEFVMPVLQELYDEQKKTGKPLVPSQLIWKLGEYLKES
ncbi:MAG: deoxyhypusine synthase family protein, partial [Candidatus Pacearchaeota archaeon]|nr:deoxyhypusine synthase family protein [Candidatus Pacearchaeota archaeon]